METELGFSWYLCADGLDCNQTARRTEEMSLNNWWVKNQVGKLEQKDKLQRYGR